MVEPLISRQTPPTIFCLLGTSRCGSTLLQSAIARLSGAMALGEISRVHELLEKQSACACGERIATCRFWAAALRDLRRTTPMVAWSAAPWHQRGERLRGVLAAATGRRSLAAPAERESALALAQALMHLTEEPERPLFIDSSKDPAEFLRLTLLPSHRVIPVHLVRDPRAVAWSGFRRAGIDPMAMARHWARLNLAIVWLKRLTSHYPWQFVRYEDFCAAPSSVRTRLLAVTGCEEDFDVSRSANHAMGGSPGFSIDNQSIMLDEQWKEGMPRDLQRRIMQKVGRMAHRLGYIEQ